MKIWKIAGAVSAAVLLASAAGLAVCRNEDAGNESRIAEQDKIPVIEEKGNSPPGEEEDELLERLSGFAQVIYQYDTDERLFYEGAEEYMTDEAFLQLRPSEVSEEGGGQKIRVRSQLISTESYIRHSGEAGVEVIMENRFTLSLTGSGSVVQYLKLAVRKVDGRWTITECHVIDTIEE